MAITLFASFSSFLKAFTTSVSPFASVTGYTFLGGGASAAIYLDVGGVTNTFTAVSGINYVGVPGPDLATGLPVLMAALAYGGYCLMRRSRTANPAI